MIVKQVLKAIPRKVVSKRAHQKHKLIYKTFNDIKFYSTYKKLRYCTVRSIEDTLEDSTQQPDIHNNVKVAPNLKIQYNSLDVTKGYYSPFPLGEELKDYTGVDIETISHEIDEWIEINHPTFELALNSMKQILAKIGAPSHKELGKRLYDHIVTKFGESKELFEEYILFLMKARLRNAAEALLYEMRVKKHIIPTKNLYLKLVMIFGKVKSKETVDMLYDFWKKDIGEDVELYCQTLEAYANAKYLDEAIEVFNIAKEKYPSNLNPYKSMIRAYCKRRRVEDAARLLLDLHVNQPFPDLEIYHIIMYSAGKLKNFDLVERLFRQVEGYNMNSNVHTWNILIYTYCNCEQLEVAKNTFYALIASNTTPNIETISILVRSCVQNKDYRSADEYAGYLRDVLGIRPDKFIYNWLIEGNTKLRDWDRLFLILDEMLALGFNLDAKVKNLLRLSCIKHGKIEEYSQRLGEIDQAIKESIEFSNSRKNKGHPYDELLLEAGFLGDGVIQKGFRHRDWNYIDDLFSVPKEATLKKREERERSKKLMEIIRKNADDMARKDAKRIKNERDLKRHIDSEKDKIAEAERKEEQRLYRESKPKFTFR